MAIMSSFKHHPSAVVSTSTTKILFPSCFWCFGGYWLPIQVHSGGRLWQNIWWWGLCRLRLGERNGEQHSLMFLQKPLCLVLLTEDLPHVMVGDAAFPLKSYLRRPYSGQNLTRKKRIFNYVLSRARMVIENAFGFLASHWRIFHWRIDLHPKNVDTRVVAACILHNFLLAPSDNVQLLEEAEELGRHMAPVRNRASREACAVRESLATFFTSPGGSVSWQDRMIWSHYSWLKQCTLFFAWCQFVFYFNNVISSGLWVISIENKLFEKKLVWLAHLKVWKNNYCGHVFRTQTASLYSLSRTIH